MNARFDVLTKAEVYLRQRQNKATPLSRAQGGVPARRVMARGTARL
jgi:hypothetical protein